MISIANFGDRLRMEREKQGFSLADVAQETKIRQHYLVALENEDFDSLPARVYSVGFVASYARFLKLDADKLVKDFKNIAYINEPVDIDLPEPVSEGKVFGFPVRNVLAATIFLALVIWLGNYVASYISQRAIIQPPLIEQSNTDPASENNAVSSKLALAVQAQERSWVQVIVDGNVVYVGTMAVGESQSFSGQERIDLRTGNAGGINLILNGIPVESLGASGQIAEKTFTLDLNGNRDQTVPNVNQTREDAGGLNLLIQAQQPSWVQVVADGQTVYSRTMAEGEIQTFSAQQKIWLKTGNAGGIILRLNNQPVEPLGSLGQIAEKTFSAKE